MATLPDFEINEYSKPKRFGPSRLESWLIRLIWVWIAVVGVSALVFFTVLSILVLEMLLREIT